MSHLPGWEGGRSQRKWKQESGAASRVRPIPTVVQRVLDCCVEIGTAAWPQWQGCWEPVQGLCTHPWGLHPLAALLCVAKTIQLPSLNPTRPLCPQPRLVPLASTSPVFKAFPVPTCPLISCLFGLLCSCPHLGGLYPPHSKTFL